MGSLRSTAVSSRMTALASPTIGTSAARFLPISAGSTSAWMTLASGAKRRQVAGHPVVEAGAERDQQIGLLQRRHGRDRAVHAGHAEVLRVAVGERAARHQRGHDRDAGELGEREQFLGGVGLEHAAADVQHRPLGRRDQLGGLAHLLGVRAQVGPVAREVELLGPGEGGLGLQDVLGQVDEHRAGTSGATRCGTPRRSSCGMSAGSVTRKLCLVIGSVMPQMSASWKASLPIAGLGTWPVMATIGTLSM